MSTDYCSFCAYEVHTLMPCINKEAAENKASQAKRRFFTEDSKQNAEFMHEVRFAEALTWLVSYYNMAFCCHAHFLILDQLVAHSRGAHYAGEQPLARCIVSRIAGKTSYKIYCVFVSFVFYSRVYLCNSVENSGALFQPMWVKSIWPT